nr:hypothetical protein [Tanacetum cinerariifolium]
EGALPLSTIGDARVFGTAARASKQGFDTTKFITLRSSSTLCQEKGRIDANMNRL